ELVVHDLQADGHILIFGMSLDAIEKGDAMVRTLFVGHPLALPPDRNHVGATARGALIERGVHRFLQLVVNLGVEQPLLKADAAGRPHRGNQSVFLQNRPILYADQVHAPAARAGRFAARIFKRHFGIEVRPPRGLLETAFVPPRSWRCSLCRGSARGGQCCQQVSASHRWNYTPPRRTDFESIAPAAGNSNCSSTMRRRADAQAETDRVAPINDPIATTERPNPQPGGRPPSGPGPYFYEPAHLFNAEAV